MKTGTISRPQVLSLAYHPTDINVLLPVYLQIINEDQFDLTVLAGTDIVCKNLNSFGVSYTQDKDSFINLLDEKSSAFLLLAADFKHIAHMLGSWSCYIAREKGIPSLSIQHGFISNEAVAKQFKTFTADAMAVWGIWFYDYLLLDGSLNPEQLVITGNPFFDNIPSCNKRDYREQITKSFNLDESRPQILLAIAAHGFLLDNGMNREDVAGFIASILNACPEESVIIIKPHPAESVQKTEYIYQEAASLASRDVVLLPTDLDSRFLIAAVDLVISLNSTILAEAHICQTPVIGIVRDKLRYANNGIAEIEGLFFVESEIPRIGDELAGSITDALGFRYKRDFEHPLSDVYQYSRHGAAAKNIYTYIRSMVGI